MSINYIFKKYNQYSFSEKDDHIDTLFGNNFITRYLCQPPSNYNVIQAFRFLKINNFFTSSKTLKYRISFWSYEELQLLLVEKDIYDEIKSHNIDLKLNSGLKEILDNGTKAIMENGDKIPFDIALLSIGITANTDIVSNTNIETKKGKIVINDKFETNIKDVYAIGDCVLSKFYNTSDDLYAPFGDVANKHGMLLAKHLSGQEISWKGLLRSFASSIYEVKLAQTGLSLEEAMDKGYDADIIEMKALYRNSAFGGKIPNKMEVIYDKKTKKILGAA